MKMIKCDRCGKKEDTGGPVFCAGIDPVYFGHVTQYRLGEMPDIHGIDLCRSCGGQLNEWIRKFMESMEKKKKR